MSADRPGVKDRSSDTPTEVAKRSMSCYLVQSVTLAAVFTPFPLGLSGAVTVSGTALPAAVTWAVTVVIADRMRRAGRRGPFE